MFDPQPFKRVLLYAGVHDGSGLLSYILSGQFTDIIGFEPDKEVLAVAESRLEQLKPIMKEKGKEFPSIQLVNVALANQNGTAKFNINGIRASSSLATINEEGYSPDEVIEVPVRNLYEFLVTERSDIVGIDHYVSDLQGFDLLVLKTMAPFINARLISNIQAETYNDRAPDTYKDVDNNLSSFRDYLSRNYNLVKIFGDYDPETKQFEEFTDPVREDLKEFDCLWTLK